MNARPAEPSAVIRDPHTKRVLPAEGGQVPNNSFWRRRLRAKEIVLLDEPTTPDFSAAVEATAPPSLPLLAPAEKPAEKE